MFPFNTITDLKRALTFNRRGGCYDLDDLCDTRDTLDVGDG
jgi:hypothetical protein